MEMITVGNSDTRLLECLELPWDQFTICGGRAKAEILHLRFEKAKRFSVLYGFKEEPLVCISAVYIRATGHRFLSQFPFQDSFSQRRIRSFRDEFPESFIANVALLSLTHTHVNRRTAKCFN